jgi:putative ABC transport system substrate-binding protein
MVVRAQTKMPVIGRIYLGDASQQAVAGYDSVRAAWVRGLNDTGFFVDHNVSILTLTAAGQLDRVPALVTDLVKGKVDLIFGNSNVAIAAKAVTSTIPVVFVGSGDPVASGLVASFNHPGGNVTGVRLRVSAEATAKLIELVPELLPATITVGMLINPQFPYTASGTAAVQAATTSLGLKVVVAEAKAEADLEPAMSKLVEAGAGAFLIGDNVFFSGLRDQIAQLAMRDRLPMFAAPWFADGALASYGADDFDSIRQAAIYMGRILKGEKPEDLPVLQPTKFKLVVNLKIAKALGLAVPPSLLARADEVIE